MLTHYLERCIATIFLALRLEHLLLGQLFKTVVPTYVLSVTIRALFDRLNGRLLMKLATIFKVFTKQVLYLQLHLALQQYVQHSAC